MGGKSKARERQQKAGGGGSVVASATAVILLLRGSAARGCAEGRSVEKTEERRTGGKARKERLDSTATAAAACQEKRGKEGDRGKKEGCRIALEESFVCFFSCTGRKILIKGACFLSADAFLYGLMQEACLEIV